MGELTALGVALCAVVLPPKWTCTPFTLQSFVAPVQYVYVGTPFQVDNTRRSMLPRNWTPTYTHDYVLICRHNACERLIAADQCDHIETHAIAKVFACNRGRPTS